MGPQRLLDCSVQLPDPLGGCDDVDVVEESKNGLPIPQASMHRVECGMGSEQASRGRPAPPLLLGNGVGSARGVDPRVGARCGVELPGIRKKRLPGLACNASSMAPRET